MRMRTDAYAEEEEKKAKIENMKSKLGYKS
jgi:hypothetical protein